MYLMHRSIGARGRLRRSGLRRHDRRLELFSAHCCALVLRRCAGRALLRRALHRALQCSQLSLRSAERHFSVRPFHLPRRAHRLGRAPRVRFDFRHFDLCCVTLRGTLGERANRDDKLRSSLSLRGAAGTQVTKKTKCM